MAKILVYFEPTTKGKGPKTGQGMLAMVIDAGSSDPAISVLAWVVSNLRNYYGLNADETTELVQRYLPVKGGPRWSPEAILYTWEQVADQTPAMAYRDQKTQALLAQRAIEDQATELICIARPGGRMKCKEFFDLFKSQFPDTDASANDIGRAVHAITGLGSYTSKGVRFYRGFHLPLIREDVAA